MPITATQVKAVWASHRWVHVPCSALASLQERLETGGKQSGVFLTHVGAVTQHIAAVIENHESCYVGSLFNPLQRLLDGALRLQPQTQQRLLLSSPSWRVEASS